MQRVDFAQVRTIPIASVLSHYRVETRKRSNTELVAQCPLPSHPSDSKHEWTLAISTEIEKAYCHNTRCRQASNKPKGLDSIDFVAMMENLTPLDAAKRLAERFSVGDYVTTSENESRQKLSTNTPPSKPLSNSPLAFELKHLDPTHPYITTRGITKETAMAFGIGFHAGKGSMTNRICFPLIEAEQLVGYCGRSIDDSEPRWKLPNGLIKSFLYGLERCDPSKPLYLVEGCWAVLFLAQHQTQAAAMLGSSLTEAQEALLEPYAEIRVALDFDDAGKAAAEKIVERLRPNHKVSKALLRK